MGSLQLCSSPRLQWVDYHTSKMKLLVLSSVIAASLGAPDAEADADAYYAQYQWPAAYAVGPYGHGFSSTCYGCRPVGHFLGKRSADADAFHGLYGLGYARAYGYGPGVAHHGTGHSYVHQGIQGLPHHLGKRDADADAEPEATPEADAEADADAHYGYYGYGGYGLGVPHHPYALAHPYVGYPAFGYPAYGYGLHGHLGKRSADPHGVVALAHPLGVAGHPGHATSYVGPTTFGYPRLHYGKRSADADAEADADAHYGLYGYGGYGYGFPGGYTHVSGLAHYRPYAYGLGPYYG